jgi:hypothetical protein
MLSLPDISRQLLAVDPNVAKTLAFVALRRTSLGPRSLNLDEERKG